MDKSNFSHTLTHTHTHTQQPKQRGERERERAKRLSQIGEQIAFFEREKIQKNK